MRNNLPKTCFAVMPGEGNLVLLKRGERGYYRSNLETGNRLENKKIADWQNHRMGITPAQVLAMQIGSMYGFDVPGANPQLYFDIAKLVSTHSLGLSAVLYADDSYHKSITGRVQQYQIAGETCFYLELASVPESMAGTQSDSIIWPDMVHGKPLIPVSLKWLENYACEMTLERSSFTSCKEVNAGYQITAKVSVGPVEYAMGELDGKFPSFVTWERTPANDGNGPPNYYWGHYFDSRDKAIQDFCKRAEEKFHMLSEQRKPSIKDQLSVAKAITQAEKPTAQQYQKDKGAR